MITTSQFEAATEEMHQPLRLIELATVNGNKSRLDLDAIESAMQVILDNFQKIRTLVNPPTSGVNLSSVERRVALTKALLKVGRELNGGMVLPADSMLDRVVNALEGDAAIFWAQQPDGMVASLLAAEPEITELLQKEGILAWAGDDKRVRVVNTRWLIDEQRIAEFVTAEPQPGRRCRFCCAVEADDNFELQPLDPDRRGKLDVLISGLDGKRQSVINASYIHAHPKCAPHWERFVEIARKVHREAAA